MEANGQTLYNDDLLNILPDGVIILDINREVIQLNQQIIIVECLSVRFHILLFFVQCTR